MSDALLERERELSALHRLIDEAVAGRGGVALIEGPAGIGKSRLLAAARERAAGRMTLLGARCGELERDFAFGAVRQLFEPLVRERRTFAGAAEPAAAVLAPAAADDALAEGAFAVLHGLYWATLELAEERPLLLAIDDLQWSDAPSLRFVAYLARRLEDVPVLVAATLRSADPGTDPGLLAEIAGDPLTAAVRPAPLGAAAVAALVRTRLGEDADPRFCAACAEATGGNPLLLRQLLNALEEDGVRPHAPNAQLVREVGPRAVARSVLRRLTRLPAEALAVARAVAVLGDSSRLPAVAALTGLDEAAVARAVGELARADILAPELPLGFVHPLVRDAVYRDLPTGERELEHARAAEVLARGSAPEEEVAAQLVQAPRRGEPESVALLRRAARRARRQGGPESAISYLARALDEPPRPELRPTVLYELGLAESDMSAPDSAAHLREAHRGLTDPAERATAAFTLAQSLMFTDGAVEGSRIAHEELRRTPAELADERRALEGLIVLATSFGGEDPDGLWDAALTCERPTEGEGLGAALWNAAIGFARAASALPAAEAERFARAAVDAGPLTASANGFFWSALMLTLTLTESPRARPFSEASRAEAYRRGGVFALASIELWGGFQLLLDGELTDAGDACAEAVRLQEPWGSDPKGGSWSRGLLGRQRLLSGADGAEVRTALGPPPEPGDESDGANHWRATQAGLLLREGAAEEALAVARAMGATRPPILHPTWRPWRSLAGHALAQLDRRAEAVELVDEELALAERIGAPALLGRTQRIRAEVGFADDAVERLRAAAELLAATPARLERALALAALGDALRRGGHVSEAREPLREALELAEACGARLLVERVRADLYAAGARPRTAALAGVASLTARELRVAQLAADGQTNREIAQVLYVTPKTVEVHLSNAYRKLEIRSRRELPVALAG